MTKRKSASLVDELPSISIAGCGWYGMELAKSLLKLGHQVKGSTTSLPKIKQLKVLGVDPFLIQLEHDNAETDLTFFRSEILIICIPPGRNKENLKSYTEKIGQLGNLAAATGIQQVLMVSSTAVYKDSKQVLTEADLPNSGTEAAKELVAAENILKENKAFNTTIIRFSGLVGPKRHPGRFFAGKKDIPNGKSPVNLVHLEDAIGVMLNIIEHKSFGKTFLVSTPDHPEKQLFYTRAAQAAKLEIPEFRDELLDWKIISSKALTSDLNYTFKINNWTNWLEETKEDPNQNNSINR